MLTNTAKIVKKTDTPNDCDVKNIFFYRFVTVRRFGDVKKAGNAAIARLFWCCRDPFRQSASDTYCLMQPRFDDRMKFRSISRSGDCGSSASTRSHPSM